MATEKATLNLTKDDLLEILREARRPADPTPEEAEAREAKKKAREQAMQDRREMAETIKIKHENDAMEKKLCSHLRKDGSGRVVLVKPDGDPIYIICQKCQAIIRPHEKERLYDSDIVDPMLFSKLLQLSQDTPIFD